MAVKGERKRHHSVKKVYNYLNNASFKEQQYLFKNV